MTRLNSSLLTALALAALACSSTVAAAKKAKELYRPTPATVSAETSRLDSLKTIRTYVGAAAAGQPCAVGWVRVPSFTLTGRKLTVRCTDRSEHVFPFHEVTLLGVWSDPEHKKVPTLWLQTSSASFTLAVNADQGRKVADAFWLLVHKRAPANPANDAEFLARVAAAKTAGDRSEDQRRTVVQADVLLKENRTEDALRLYEEGLTISPDWALGHYNLALIYASLELYPEAVTEMRRYLYLAPGAEDARAAQDQVYAWEAMLGR